MSHVRTLRAICAAAFIYVFTVSVASVAAQSTEIEGVIKARSGDTMLLQTSDASELSVQLTDSTNVEQYEGMLKARHKDMSMAALIPGLPVKVKGSSDSQNQFVAETVRFKGNDLERAKATQAGMHETNQKVAQNQQAIAANQAELAKHQQAIDEAVARFGQLDDYYIFDEVTVYFTNGKSAVDPKYVPQLQALAEKAKGIEGYMIEVKGFTSTTGSTAANQALSEDRADNVTNILIQQCKMPLTRMLAPGAMGESEQVGENAETEQGQAQNRRVVVRVLQNKAIAGKAAQSGQ